MTSETEHKWRREARRKKRLREWSTHLLLFLLVCIYSFVGAKLFQSIEQKHEERVKIDLVQAKHRLLDKLSVG